ncbi:MAG: hypothetical protein ACNI3A_02315 [Desulfovibrio sp.]|uniref:hypothetical protein n=1 Tax=Desulfovibrio sp. 7SRBS1 TaxID=3378064 RepID=UPI003B3DCE18
MRKANWTIWGCLLVAVFLLSSCAKSPAPFKPLQKDTVLAVAGFKNPRYNWELLAGCMPDQCNIVKPEVLDKLNTMLTDALSASGRNFIGVSMVRQCQELVGFEQRNESQQAAALRYWLNVGRCVPCDYLLVPQLMSWKQRDGGDWGVRQPASVVMHFYLLDIRNQGIVKTSYYDETQEPLSGNLLEAGTFFKRGAKWVTAERLASDGISEAIQELGL